MKAVSEKTENDWQAEDDLRTIQRAVEVVNDKKRYDAAMKQADKQKKALEKVSSIRNALTGGA